MEELKESVKKLTAKVEQLAKDNRERYKAEMDLEKAKEKLTQTQELYDIADATAPSDDDMANAKSQMEKLEQETEKYKSATQGVMNLLESIIKFESAYRLYTMEQ